MKRASADLLLGVAVGDALGVPFEFSDRKEMELTPAKDMVGYRVHNQPAGTWSDDSSLTFCLAESMVDDYNLGFIARKFVKWRNEAYWTAYNEAFDIGLTTARAITRLENIFIEAREDDLKLLRYDAKEYDNGNGSLMRILPLVFELRNKSLVEQFTLVWENSALTHRHIRAGMSCMIYLKLAEFLLNGFEKNIAYQRMRDDIKQLWLEIEFSSAERLHFGRIIENDIRNVSENEILSGGYVIESLEASLWCFLQTDSYSSAVLKAINFGHDTDTTGAITGGLAGIYYKKENIPEFWIASIARLQDILSLAEKLDEKYNLI